MQTRTTLLSWLRSVNLSSLNPFLTKLWRVDSALLLIVETFGHTTFHFTTVHAAQ